jgi:hypothetical protein
MTKTESNKLIAKFMGIDESMPHDHSGIYPYDSDWNWLMPVYAKIMNLLESDLKGYVDLSQKLYRDTNKDMYDIISNAVSEPNKTLVYLSSIDFIIWYNKNNN